MPCKAAILICRVHTADYDRLVTVHVIDFAVHSKQQIREFVLHIYAATAPFIQMISGQLLRVLLMISMNTEDRNTHMVQQRLDRKVPLVPVVVDSGVAKDDNRISFGQLTLSDTMCNLLSTSMRVADIGNHVLSPSFPIRAVYHCVRRPLRMSIRTRSFP